MYLFILFSTLFNIDFYNSQKPIYIDTKCHNKMKNIKLIKWRAAGRYM